MSNSDGRRRLPIMVRAGRKSQKPYWPFMELWGLHRRPIVSDGNCLFRALSDQLFDTTERHDEIRQTVVWYLRANREQFEPFVPLDTEDLVRSQPNTRSSRSRRASAEDPYEAYLENMAKPKTWGGEVEIRAFSEAYDRDVLIHRPTDAGQPFDQMVNNKRAAGQPRQFVHVSFGGESTHPHYESVRPIKSASPAASHPSSTPATPLCGPADKPLSLPEYSTEPLNQIQQARPNLSAEELYSFLEKSRNQLDTIFGQIINTDRERSSSASASSQRSSSSKRSRDDNGDGEEEDSDNRASKRAMRRISLRNKTHAFVTYITPASSQRGTEISFKIRVDTPPGTPTENPEPEKGAAEKGKGGSDGEKNDNECAKEGGEEREGPTVSKSDEENVPDTTDKSPKTETEEKAAVSGKPKGGSRGRAKTRARNA
ncbi:hypothetical protein EPUS_06164 [Endocarpon pusillum Z07020]|uniref:OTU domain-containing protein n=1 Tax=Endocarpon pusillum (strain Z07020 / HMAS-L-300199) TaxID=1263415 RepID=U1GFS5_ENDPU|nr:uncharacterized protein EPUS_06164 [Endocarpon pusillum Z07020]XP_007787631.1 uncharacterized protein EPUS_09405 [Endocarpon pusillum Z07020]XP_007787636.1 uncharacterized protein EPUS_09410 [Endocarpon pusillum Z07020]ERF75031.1 hypothetical protein EPUS_09405 [Endocarpon pusillum Z07020]ERF75036.1 hypothetical protein EPUS_09410 [Endocarpon pusillum Z07020]ERF76502.1 hypothetical protein EPUS_06164 [Endocarpon pusillum Z07020]